MNPIFFDLDGTLIDSKLDLANSVNAALSHFGISLIDNNTIYQFVGNGVKQLLIDSLKHNDRMDIFDEFYTYFLEHYHEHLLDNTKVYNGMFKVLDCLRGKYIMFIVTNKSEKFARKVAEGLNISKYFIDIVGGDTFSNKKPHPEPVLRLKEKYNLNIQDAFLIGDSENDILAAKALDLTMIWASYGFRDRTILQNHTVDYVIDTPEDILKIIK